MTQEAVGVPVSDSQTHTHSPTQPENEFARTGLAGPRGADRHVPGEPGVWILLLGDLMIFAALFSIFLLRRGAQHGVFAQSQQHLNRTLGFTNTIVLLTSSLMLVLAVRSMRRDQLRRFVAPLALSAATLGLCFVGVKALEYHALLSSGFGPGTDQFFMYYFVLTGLHLGHIIIGLGVLTALWRLAKQPAITATHIAFFEGGACFWHMVDLLWIMIFALVFLVR